MQMWDIWFILDMKHKKKYNLFLNFFSFEGYLKGSPHCHSNVWVWGLMFKLKCPQQFPCIPARKGRWSVPPRGAFRPTPWLRLLNWKCICTYAYAYVCAYPFGTEIQNYQHDLKA